MRSIRIHFGRFTINSGGREVGCEEVESRRSTNLGGTGLWESGYVTICYNWKIVLKYTMILEKVGLSHEQNGKEVPSSRREVGRHHIMGWLEWWVIRRWERPAYAFQNDRLSREKNQRQADHFGHLAWDREPHDIPNGLYHWSHYLGLEGFVKNVATCGKTKAGVRTTPP